MDTELTTRLVTDSEAVTRLYNGELGVLATDTIYGVVTSALQQTAVERLYTLKHRERKPGTLVASSIDQLRQLGVPEAYFKRLAPYWPGALSAVLPISDTFAYLHQGVGDIAIRIVADKRFRAIIEQTGPLLTSSANRPGEPGSVTITEAWDYFKDAVDFYVDSGDLSGRPPSTIVKLNDDGSLAILRQGAVEITK